MLETTNSIEIWQNGLNGHAGMYETTVKWCKHESSASCHDQRTTIRYNMHIF